MSLFVCMCVCVCVCVCASVCVWEREHYKWSLSYIILIKGRRNDEAKPTLIFVCVYVSLIKSH